MPSYANDIRAHECSLAIEQFLIGAYGATFTPARINVDSPPDGFVHLGAVVEDTPTIRVTREMYKLETGIPKVIQMQTILNLGAEISFSLYSNSFFQAQFMLGNTAITTVSTIASGSISTQYYGKSTITKYHLLGVADFLNGSQVIHEFPKVTPSAGWEEALRSNEASKMQLTFTAEGYKTTIDSCSHLIIGKRHYMNGGGQTCTV